MKHNEAQKIKKALQEVNNDIPNILNVMGNQAVNHFKKSFIDGGFTDRTFEPWQKRKDTRDNYRRGSQRRSSGGTRSLNVGRGVLTKTGNLARSIKFRRLGMYAVQIESNVRYAKIHNDGLMGKAWGKHPFKMPKRQFVGYSTVLTNKIKDKIDIRIRRIFTK